MMQQEPAVQGLLELMDGYAQAAMERLSDCTLEEVKVLQGTLKAYKKLTSRIKNGVPNTDA